MSKSPSRLLLAFFVAINCLLWSQSSYLSMSTRLQPAGPLHSRIAKRFLKDAQLEANGGIDFAEKCDPMAVPQHDQCSYVQSACPQSSTFLSIQYVKAYFCSKPAVRPLTFIGLTLWLAFLFATLGISASDFFCPNLASISNFLGLDENVAGVTFLAFGNGSPDVFSTFSAMRAGSGSLAIGELLGAASFIVSVVVGSMCIIKPFRVERYPFLRDVGFFTLAVSFLLAIAYDGSIHAWEAGVLVLLYTIYVVVVVVGSWWERRQDKFRAREALIRQEYAADEMPRPYAGVAYHDEEEPLLSTPRSIPGKRQRALSATSPGLRVEPQYTEHRLHHSMHDLPPRSPHVQQLPSFSLLGALEFRQVITSLQHDSSAGALAIFEAPISPFAAGHYHRHRSPPRPGTPITQTQHDEETDPWDAALGMPLNERHDSNGGLQVPGRTRDGQFKTPSIIITTPAESVISLPPDHDESFTSSEVGQVLPLTRKQWLRRLMKSTLHTLFPTLHGFKSKTLMGQIVAVFATPAVLALTVTLPVVISTYGDAHVESEAKPDERLVDFEEEGMERALTAEAVVEAEMRELRFNKWLMACQACLGPIFCVLVLFSRSQHLGWILGLTAIASTAVAVAVAIFADRGNDRAGRLIRCFMGFIVAVVWIMAIADEVVSVLQTFGFIFGLSDAIIGLTVFAVGNSMADFVADISVATFAPIMGFSACFGGPMLNILLGVGGSGTYVIRQTGEPFTMHFSTTLLVSTIGLLVLLLTTLAVVPFNGYWLSKRWGVFLICFYVVIMVINVVVEIKHA